ncbi:MAG: hypothetical protein J1F67_02000 [Muribaculaceae bacterium]|nr:hypothetical protein [Muribaculaceae bacterium]
MRQRISYNSDDYSGTAIIWFILICVLCFFCFWPDWGWGDYNYQSNYVDNGTWNWGGWWWFWIIIGILFFWWICTLFYTPIDVYADDDEVRIRRPLKSRRIKMSEIASAEPYQVSKNPNKKAFGSSPIKSFGRWGKYNDEKIGDYFAYYGKPDNTVLIKLKDGRQYVVGGSDAKALAEYINSKKK